MIGKEGRVLALIDLESPVPARFDAEDAAGCEALAALFCGPAGLTRSGTRARRIALWQGTGATANNS